MIDRILPGASTHTASWKDADFGFLKEIKQLELGSVLDFGCGLGRNLLPLTKVFRHVDGYDLPAMIQRLKDDEVDVCDSTRFLSSEWSVVKKRRYDLIVSEVVFQHIYEMVLIPYLHDIAAMSPYLWVLTRSWNDDHHKNNTKIINDTGLFTVEYVRERPGNILGMEPVSTEAGIRDAMEKLMRDDLDYHCAMLLRSNLFHKHGSPSAGEHGHERTQPLGERQLEIFVDLARRQSHEESGETPSEELILWDRIRDNIFFANIIHDRTLPGKAGSSRRLIGRLPTLAKRLVERLINWYMEPALENQREFNAYISQATTAMMDYLNHVRENEDKTSANIRRDLELMSDNIMIINKYLDRLSPEFQGESARLREPE